MIRKLIAALSLVACAAVAYGQNELLVGQYVHNRFAVNPSFAGSREGVTVFGSFRKQWAGIERTPQSILLSTHAPLKSNNLVVGLSLYNQMVHQSVNSGLQAAIGYRTRVTHDTWLSFALQPGVSLRSTDWTKVSTTAPGDLVFAERESSVSPLLGFGASWYGRDFFAGASVVSFFVANDFDQRDAKFAPDQATYIVTGGYLFKAGSDFHLQPSVLASYNSEKSFVADVTVSAIYRNFAWLTAAYRTSSEAVIGAAAQITPQLRAAYNYEFTVGDLNGYNSGSHEISLQFDLVYKLKKIGPKFY